MDSYVNCQHFRSISEVSERTGLTARALRFYEERGLLQPLRIGNRRHYDDDCLSRLETIAQGKQMGMPLDAIELLLSTRANEVPETQRQETIKHVLERHRNALLNRQEQTGHQLKITESMLAS